MRDKYELRGTKYESAGSLQWAVGRYKKHLLRLAAADWLQFVPRNSYLCYVDAAKQAMLCAFVPLCA
jgi:hypothetical protein